MLSGGEPLLRPDLFEIARYGTEKGFRMCVATNGTLVTDDVVGKMKDAGVKICSLSLDGSTAAVHDDFRKQPGAFEATLRAAETFRRNGMQFIVNSSFTNRNRHDIAATCLLAKSIGAHAWYMFMIVPTGRGQEIMSELIGKEEYEEILEWHYRMEKDEKEMLVRPTCAPHYYRVRLQKMKEEGETFEPRSLTFSTGGGKGCVCAQSICFIDSRGNVQPCSYFPVVAGNVKKEKFARDLARFGAVQLSAGLRTVQGPLRRVRIPEGVRRVQGESRRDPRRLSRGGAVLQLHADQDPQAA